MTTELSALSAVVYVEDVDRVSQFYAAVLGVPVAAREDRYAQLTAPGWELVVHAIGSPVPASSPSGSQGAAPREQTPIKLVFPVAAIEPARALAPTLGGRILGVERQWRFGGTLRCDGVDPEGNVFQLCQADGA